MHYDSAPQSNRLEKTRSDGVNKMSYVSGFNQKQPLKQVEDKIEAKGDLGALYGMINNDSDSDERSESESAPPSSKF